MNIYKKEELKNWTNFKIGGIADILAEPANMDELVELIKFLRNSNYIYYILGNGTNILVSDKGVRGCVVHIGKNLAKIIVNENKIEAEAGALLSDIAKVAYENELTGLEELSGIPGSIGGAVAMNAGAYNKEISDVVSYVNVIDDLGKIKKLNCDNMDFEYRKSIITEKNYIVTSVVLNLQKGDKNTIMQGMENFKKLRESKQPLDWPSAGSIFKRPSGHYASLLIEESCLKGEKIGEAMVSEKHSGFIINTGNATASDVNKLIQKIQNEVMTYHNVKLEPEIKFWGYFNNGKKLCKKSKKRN